MVIVPLNLQSSEKMKGSSLVNQVMQCRLLYTSQNKEAAAQGILQSSRSEDFGKFLETHPW